MKRQSCFAWMLLLGASLSASAAFGASREIHVAVTGADNNTGGVSDPYRTVKFAVSRAASGDTILVHEGTYDEVMKIQVAGITIRGAGSTRPVLDAAGLSVSGSSGDPRAIFQIEANNVVLDSLEMTNARNGDNGAGVRIREDMVNVVSFTIQNCKITYCDMGMQGGSQGTTLVQGCEIAFNGTSLYNGYSHNFYMAGPGSIVVKGCYIHDSLYGQNFKSRAHYNELLYNWIADSNEGEVGPVDDATNTSKANSNMLMAGNTIISKPNRDGNSMKYVNFGNDGGKAHNGTLYAYNNTMIGNDSRIDFLWVTDSFSSTHIVARNNILYSPTTPPADSVNASSPSGSISGACNWMRAGSATTPGVFTATLTGSDPGFTNFAAGDFSLLASSPCVNAGTSDLTYVDGNGVTHSLTLDHCYLLGQGMVSRPASGALDVGAYERTIVGDINNDGTVDTTDLLILAANWAKSTGQPGFDPACDLNHDGQVDIVDLLYLADNWGQ
jgi:hypothetical protein